MTEDFYLIAMTALLPLTAGLLVSQINPYHALVIRGILGAISALIYALFGAADVALTEALVGTMLSITLYAVAVRSSMSMRLGVLEETPDADGSSIGIKKRRELAPLLANLNPVLTKYHMRVELLTYPDQAALTNALMEKEIHGTHGLSESLQIRIQRLHDIIQAELPTLGSTYIDVDRVKQQDKTV